MTTRRLAGRALLALLGLLAVWVVGRAVWVGGDSPAAGPAVPSPDPAASHVARRERDAPSPASESASREERLGAAPPQAGEPQGAPETQEGRSTTWLLEGRLVDAQGRPVSGASVTLWTPPGPPILPVLTDAGGAFSFRGERSIGEAHLCAAFPPAGLGAVVAGLSLERGVRVRVPDMVLCPRPLFFVRLVGPNGEMPRRSWLGVGSRRVGCPPTGELVFPLPDPDRREELAVAQDADLGRGDGWLEAGKHVEIRLARAPRVQVALEPTPRAPVAWFPLRRLLSSDGREGYQHDFIVDVVPLDAAHFEMRNLVPGADYRFVAIDAARRAAVLDLRAPQDPVAGPMEAAMLRPPLALEVCVVAEAEGAPVADAVARVACTFPDSPDDFFDAAVSAGEDGCFRLDSRPAIPHRIEVEADGFVPRTLTVLPEEASAPVEVRLRRPAAVWVEILGDEDGHFEPSARWVGGTEPGSVRRGQFLSDLGLWRIEDLRPGLVEVVCRLRGQEADFRFADWRLRRELSLEPGAQAHVRFDVRDLAPARLSVLVRGSAGDPMDGVGVLAVGEHGLRRSGVTDGEGRVRWTLVADRYDVFVGSTFPGIVEPDPDAYLARADVVLAPGAGRTLAVDLLAGNLEVTVVDRRGRPLPEAEVELADAPGASYPRMWLPRRTDEHGTVRFEGLPSARYVVRTKDAPAVEVEVAAGLLSRVRLRSDARSGPR